MTQPFTAFLEALPAGHAPADRGSNMDFSRWLIGSWALDISAHLRDGSTRRRRPRRRRGRNVKVYGTTLRTYDHRIDAWHIQWTVPVTPSYFSMIARRQGRDVVRLEKTESGQSMRWSFSKIGPQFFYWRGELSTDNAAVWHRRGIQRAVRCPGLGDNLGWRLTRLPSFPKPCKTAGAGLS
jgi:hypothetical protein